MAAPARLPSLAAWQRFFTYALFVFSTFSIAGDEAGVMFLYLLGLLHWWRAGAVEMPPRWFIAPFVAVLAVAVLSALASVQPLATLARVREDYRLLLPFALLPALGLVDRRRLLTVFAAFVIGFALYGVVQHYTGIDLLRPEGEKVVRPFRAYGADTFHAVGNFSHHQTFAGYMVVTVPLFAALLLWDPQRRRWLWGLAALAAALAVLATMARSAWLGMAVGLLVMVFRLPRRWSAALVVLGLVALVGAGSLLLSGWLKQRLDLRQQPDLVKRIVSTSWSFDRDRRYLWEAGWLGIRDHPWLGVGPGNDAIAFAPYRETVSQRHDGYAFVTSASAGIHNLYLQLWFERGILGLLAHLWLFGTVLGWCALWIARAGPAFPRERGLLWGAAGGLVASMVAAVFENNFFDGEVQVMLLLAMSLALHAGMTVRRAWSEGPAATTAPADDPSAAPA